MTIKPIVPVDVVRDEDGWFTHPQYLTEPEWEGVESMTNAEFDTYMSDRGIEAAITSLEGDDFEMHERYCEEGQVDCSAWTPSKPAGEGWFMLSIHDTEDGPICVWGRRTEEPFVSEVVAAINEPDLFSGQSAHHEIGSLLQCLTIFTRHNFDQLMRYEDGRTPLYLTEEQYNAIRDLVAQANEAPPVSGERGITTTLLDPEAVLVNMLRGTIATPSVRAWSKLFGEVITDSDKQLLEIARLRAVAQDVSELVNALTDARQVLATALQASAPDWFKTEADIASHHTIKKIDGALATHRAQQGEQKP